MFNFIENLSYKIGDYIGKDETEDDRELYRYSVFMIFSNIFSELFGIVLSIFFGYFLEYLIIDICFMVLRMGSGGYHCDTFKKCFFYL